MRNNQLLTDTDEPLLPLVAGGNHAAVSECIRRYGPLVWAIAQRLSLTKEDAEDAVQEIFMDVWRHAARFDPGRGSEKVFVTILARRKLIDRMRRQKLRRAVELPIDDGVELPAPPTMRAERDVEMEEARDLFSHLPIPQQRVIALSLVQGMSHAEIVSHTGLPLGTVKTLLRRGILRVRALLTSTPRLPKTRRGVS
jgi:RNA polymerase sigma-70 factor (ECF subfamily)